LELPDFLFDAVLHQQAVSNYVARLAYAMRAVNRLHLDRRVPPRME
jgi:hypothetical protein